MTSASPIVELALNDIYCDAENASAVLTRSAHRRGRVVTGLVRAASNLLVILGEESGGRKPVYRFAELSGTDVREILAALRGREIGGYLTLGSWETSGRLWGLFVRAEAVR